MISGEARNRARFVLSDPLFQRVRVADVKGAAAAVEHVGPEAHGYRKE
jgi:hypothetical protein